MNPDHSTRYASEDDIAHIWRVIRDNVETSEYYNRLARFYYCQKYSIDYISSKLRADPSSFIISIAGDEISGVLVNTIDDFLVWIDWVFVQPKYRNAGVARSLIAAAEEKTARIGSHKIWTESLTTNVPSLRAFEKREFNQVAMLKRHWFEQDFVFLEKLIEPRRPMGGFA